MSHQHQEPPDEDIGWIASAIIVAIIMFFVIPIIEYVLDFWFGP